MNDQVKLWPLWLPVFVMLWLLSETFAYAHEAPSGMKYDAYCCNGNRVNGDCEMIPASSVRVTPDGYEVTLRPGDHRMVTVKHVFHKSYSETRVSTDNEYHACLFPDEHTLRCLYAPPMGM